MFIGCRQRREASLREAVRRAGGGAGRRAGRTQDCRCCLCGRDRLLALICPSEPSSGLPVKMMDSCRRMKGPGPIAQCYLWFICLCIWNVFESVCFPKDIHGCVCKCFAWKSLLKLLAVYLFQGRKCLLVLLENSFHSWTNIYVCSTKYTNCS